MNSYDDLSKYAAWFTDEDPCLFDVPLPQDSFLTPKIKFETGMINPKLDDNAFSHAKNILRKNSLEARKTKSPFGD